MFLLFLLALFIHELGRGRDRTAGAILAAASLLRAYPLGLIGYLVARRKWQAVGATLIVLLAGFGATAGCVGTDVIVSYAAHVVGPHPLNQPIGFLRHPANLSLGWFVRFILLHGFSVGEMSPFASVAALFAELIVFVFAFIATLRLEYDQDQRGFSLWIVTVSILSPIMWPQFMACFVIVFAALAKSGGERRANIAAIASYAIVVVFGGMKGYPLTFAQKLSQHYLANHVHVLHVLAEGTAASLILLYASCCWFILAGRRRTVKNSRDDVSMVASRA